MAWKIVCFRNSIQKTCAPLPPPLECLLGGGGGWKNFGWFQPLPPEILSSPLKTKKICKDIHTLKENLGTIQVSSFCCSIFCRRTAMECLSERASMFICFILCAVLSRNSCRAPISRCYYSIGWSFFLRSLLPIYAFWFSFWM